LRGCNYIMNFQGVYPYLVSPIDDESGRPFFQCRLFGDTPYLAARARRRGGRMIDRSKRPSSIVRPKAEYRLNEIAEAPPSRRQRVGLIAQRASRTRIRREQG